MFLNSHEVLNKHSENPIIKGSCDGTLPLGVGCILSTVWYSKTSTL